ncbi:MAG: TraA family conjugative transfer protein [Nitrospiria bacterium]
MKDRKWLYLIIVMLIAALIIPESGFAGTADLEFQSLFQKFMDWIGGYLGKTLAIAALIGGLFVGVVRQSPAAAVAGVGAAIFAAYGPIVIQGLIGATF